MEVIGQADAHLVVEYTILYGLFEKNVDVPLWSVSVAGSMGFRAKDCGLEVRGGQPSPMHSKHASLPCANPGHGKVQLHGLRYLAF